MFVCFQTYMLNTRSTFGVGGFPQGLDYYKACLKWQLSVDMTPDEIHEKGISEVNRVNREIQNVIHIYQFENLAKRRCPYFLYTALRRRPTEFSYYISYSKSITSKTSISCTGIWWLKLSITILPN
jgi:uncharacterized protein (DUF885 family)